MDNETQLSKARKIIKQQDEIIGRLTRENEQLKDSQRRRSEWLRSAKQEAGFALGESFDTVWNIALNALKNQQAQNAQAKPYKPR